MRRPMVALALALVWTTGVAGATARPPEGQNSTCDLVERAAADNGLPVDYFTRLIWRESSFRPEVVSPVGAQGIAQFMPGTAAERGLANPFDPMQAIPASAQLLKSLAERFGNLGLAAAAYNAGPRRVADWLAGAGRLPLETRHYVAVITGRSVEEWRAAMPRVPAEQDQEREKEAEARADQTCVEVLAALDAAPTMVALRAPQDEAEWQPWGVQVAGNFSHERALASYRSLQQRHPGVLRGRNPLIVRQRNLSLGPRPMVNVRIPAPTREAANDLCRKLRDDGAACVVLKN